MHSLVTFTPRALGAFMMPPWPAPHRTHPAPRTRLRKTNDSLLHICSPIGACRAYTARFCRAICGVGKGASPLAIAANTPSCAWLSRYAQYATRRVRARWRLSKRGILSRPRAISLPQVVDAFSPPCDNPSTGYRCLLAPVRYPFRRL